MFAQGNCSNSKLFSVPKRGFNVNSVPLIASSPISSKFRVQNATCYYANTTVRIFAHKMSDLKLNKIIIFLQCPFDIPDPNIHYVNEPFAKDNSIATR